MTPETSQQRPDLRGWLLRLSGPLAIAVVGIWALHQSWGFWPDVQVDFGRELYVPWRLVEGEQLHTDIAWFNGPFSAYWNALAFAVFGVGLSTLVASNLLVTIAITGLLYALVLAISDRWAAAAAGLVFVGVFAFGQTGPVANYNYIAPYSHELTHGLALALLALHLFHRWSRLEPASRPAAPVEAGWLAGLVFLTKSEVFVALIGALVAGMLLDAWGRRANARDVPGALLRVLAATLVAPAIVFVTFALSSSPRHGLQIVMGPWLSLLETRVAELDYYRWVLGTLYPEQSLERFVQWTTRYVVALGPLGLGAWLFGVLLRKRGRPVWLGWVWAGAAMLALAAVLAWPIEPKQAIQGVRPLPLITPLLIVGSVVGIARARRAGRDVSRAVLCAVACVFALGIQAKMFFNAQIFHYGFALMMPATLMWVTALVGWIPAWIERAGGSGTLFRIGAGAAILAVSLGVIEKSQEQFARRTEPVGSGRDAFVGGERAKYLNFAMDFLDDEMGEGETLVVLPEGVMLNYLLRRRNPTPYINFMPPEMILFGGRTMLDALRRDPPDYVAFVHKKTALYGYAWFGRNYGQQIHRWVTENYRPIRTIGRPPFQEGTVMGVVILKREGS